jgi:hypothetical protein
MENVLGVVFFFGQSDSGLRTSQNNINLATRSDKATDRSDQRLINEP